jgi:hypothetical protein
MRFAEALEVARQTCHPAPCGQGPGVGVSFPQCFCVVPPSLNLPRKGGGSAASHRMAAEAI